LTEAPRGSVGRDDVSALILAAGSGVRFGQSKAFLEFAGKTLLERVVENTVAIAEEVLVGLRSEDFERIPPALRSLPVNLVTGGATRHDTIEALLRQATRPIVLLHDVARPLAPPALFIDVLEAAQTFGAAAACVRVSSRDSLITEESGFAATPLSRDRVVQIQTPQAFRRDQLIDVFRNVKAPTLEEASSVPLLCMRAGYRVRVVPGHPDNIKITFPEDWDDVRSVLESRAV